MYYKIVFPVLFLLSSYLSFAQSAGPGGQPLHPSNAEGKTDTRHLRIVDTLTIQEKATRNPVILKTELDSMIRQYNTKQEQQIIKQPVIEIKSNADQYILGGVIVIIALLFFVIYLFYRHRPGINRTIIQLNEKAKQGELSTGNSYTITSTEKNNKGKSVSQTVESKISDLHAELHKLSKENEGLNRVIKEYNGIQHEYESLRHGILKTYKVKNYPGYDKTKDDTMAIQGVFQTESSVANYAYEKFLKPILAITDVNKNNPAKLSEADWEKLLDMLVSLSLLYIEYLYLRVHDLSIGGKMVERILGLNKGNGPDISLLKKLNTEFGSRALVLKMALNKAKLHRLSYPVFDETNLNTQ
jgi:cell division protein FtsB